MAVAYYGSHISEHMVKTPEGYLICYSVPINRTGEQLYTAGELGLEGDSERPVKVYRLEEDVFAPAALASLEGKDITRGHPAEMLTAENQAGYSKGHLENVRRDGDNTVADLMIKDPALASDVENGILREVSCGYNCQFEPYMDGYKQTHIIGNHVAVVPRGRAGRDVAIKDAADKAEKGLNRMKQETREALYRFFGLAARDAEPEELERLTNDVSKVLDAEPAKEAKEAEPNSDAKDEMVEKAPKGDDLGTKLDRVIEMLSAMNKKEAKEEKLSDEEDLDAMIENLSRKKEGSGEGESAVTIPAEEMDACSSGAARDATIELLKKVRPAVASIEDKEIRAKVTDALLSAVRGDDVVSAIARTAQDSALAKVELSKKTNYEKICTEAENAYAARNPHKTNKEVK